MRCKQNHIKDVSGKGAKAQSPCRSGVLCALAPLRGLLIVLVLSTLTCQASAAEPSAEGIAFFEKKVRPLLVERCIDCHTGDEPESGLSMDSLAGLLKGGLRGPAIVIDKPEESLLIRALRHGEILKMPPKEKLSARLIAEIATWIEMGAPWPNAEPVAIPQNEPESDAITFTEEQKTFWSFQSPSKSTVPAVKDQTWVRSSIDAFILRKLEAASFQPASPAIKRVLVRRATFDLLGLPPAPDEVDAFVADESPQAFAKLIDQLLASPRYGERWGRHWLDVARYADSNGLDENLAFADAYHYRDYVIAAFNKDKPFDWFVQEQIAGDLLVGQAFSLSKNNRLEAYSTWDAPYEGTVATGFLALGAKMLAEDDPVKMQMDIIDEQIDTLGRAFMGLTFGCARCHDHKFDPIPTADYYSLAGIFKSTKTMENFDVVARWQEKPLASAEATAALDEHQKKIEAKQADIDKMVNESNEAVLVESRRHVGDYLLAALELERIKNLIADATIHGNNSDPTSTPNSLLIEADEFDRGNVLRDRTNWGKGIGVLVNAGETPNFAEYDIEVKEAGLYQIEIRVAAEASRPTMLMINGQLAKKDAAGEVTGSWLPDGQKWFVEGFYHLNAGKNLIRLEQPQFFPHIDKLLFVPAPPEARASSPAQAIPAFATDPRDGIVLVEAETVARGNLSVLTEGYGEGIGIIGGPGGLNEGEIDVEIPTDGTYHVACRYAAAEARPTKLLVNGRGINSKAIGEVTGTWHPDTQRWFLEGRARLAAGKCVVRLERDGPIPHIDKIMFIEASRFGGQSEEFAPLGDYEPKPEFAQQWADYLEKTKDDPASPFADWHAAVAQNVSVRELAAAYNERVAGDIKTDKPFATVLRDPEGPFKISDKIEIYYAPEAQERLAGVRAERKTLADTMPKYPEAMAVSDGTIENIRVHIRGSHLTQGRQVPRRVPRIFTGDESTSFGEDVSGRLELARWLTGADHPLTARVMVNRIWQWHFGEGLVRSPDNFGKLGLRPTHPELLDWLAVRFVESGWSIKELHRTIMLSSAYQMSTAFNEQAMAVDPENELWWRFSRRRAEAESIRDSILAASGQLDLKMGGSMLPTANRAYVTSTANVDPVAYQTNRRSVYMPVVRSALYEVFQAFDFAEPSVPAGKRQSTTVAPQALFMMNSKIVADATRAMAEKLLENENADNVARIETAYRIAYGRTPEKIEVQRALSFVEAYAESLIAKETSPDEARIKAWQSLCRVILSANEFIYVE
ncbi:MAG: DUF1553 domain-containing protein [Planctomycetes bacterium]|nr:DUF1553 domain-containing protein [Planctomycetota bacterium]